MEIAVLRLGHRLPRDERISTHVALVARAFGAGSIAYAGQHDSGLEDSVHRICERWGGGTVSGLQRVALGDLGHQPHGSRFSVSYEKSAVSFIKAKKRDGFAVAHLTMYGIPVMEAAVELRKKSKLLVVVGSEQVPPEIYHLADFNISVTSQPHSEVAALAIVLDRLMEGRELERGFGANFKGKIRIEPSEKGKSVIEA